MECNEIVMNGEPKTTRVEDDPSGFAIFVSIVDNKYSMSAVGGEENDAGSLKRPANLISRGFINAKIVFRFEALERGQ